MRLALKHDLWGRAKEIQLELPERWNVNVLRMQGDSKSVLDDEAFRKALAPIETALEGKKEICILFDDTSRPTRAYRVVPHLVGDGDALEISIRWRQTGQWNRKATSVTDDLITARCITCTRCQHFKSVPVFCVLNYLRVSPSLLLLLPKQHLKQLPLFES